MAAVNTINRDIAAEEKKHHIQTDNPVVAGYLNALADDLPVRPWVNPAGMAFPPVSDRTAVSPKDSTATDDVYEINLGGTSATSGSTLKSSREKLPPGIYSEGYLKIAIPQLPHGIWVENAFAFIDYVQMGIGDQTKLFTIDRLVLYAWYVLFNDTKEARIIQSYSYDFGIYHPNAYISTNTMAMVQTELNLFTRPNGSLLRVPFPLPWRSPMLYGIVQAGDSMIFADSISGMITEFTVKLRSFSDVVSTISGVSLDAFPPINVSLELYRLPRSEGYVVSIWEEQKKLRPLTATWGLWTTNIQDSTIYGGSSTTKVSIDLSSMSGHTKSIGIVVQDLDNLAKKNQFSNFVRIKWAKVVIGTENIVDYQDPYATAKVSAFRRTGTRLASDTTNALNIPLGLDFDLHNSSGGMTFAQRTAKLELGFEPTSGDKHVSITVIGVCYAVQGPSNVKYVISKEDKAKGITYADLRMADRGNYERYFD